MFPLAAWPPLFPPRLSIDFQTVPLLPCGPTSWPCFSFSPHSAFSAFPRFFFLLSIKSMEQVLVPFFCVRDGFAVPGCVRLFFPRPVSEPQLPPIFFWLRNVLLVFPLSCALPFFSPSPVYVSLQTVPTLLPCCSHSTRSRHYLAFPRHLVQFKKVNTSFLILPVIFVPNTSPPHLPINLSPRSYEPYDFCP